MKLAAILILAAITLAVSLFLARALSDDDRKMLRDYEPDETEAVAA